MSHCAEFYPCSYMAEEEASSLALVLPKVNHELGFFPHDLILPPKPNVMSLRFRTLA